MTINVPISALANLNNPTTAVVTINSNFTAVQTGFSSALNTSGDQMLGNLDMNNLQIINLPAPATVNSPVRLADVANSAVIASVPPVGTSGTNTVGYLSGNNTYSGNNTFTGTNTFTIAPTFPTSGSVVFNNVSTTTLTAKSATFSTVMTATTANITTANVTGATAFSTTGLVGEMITAGNGGTTLTSGSPATIATITLTAGVWLISGHVGFSGTGLTTMLGGASFTTNTLVSSIGRFQSQGPTASAWDAWFGPIPVVLTGTSNVFLVANATGTGPAGFGNIYATRIN